MVDRIDNKSMRLPPAWMSRISGGGNLGQSEELRKLLGEPLPRIANPHTLKPEIAAMFAAGGALERIAKKLGSISKRRHKKLVPAHNTIACVDDSDIIYVGVEFLENHGEDEDLLAAILAHEWGHMLSDLPRNADWSDFSWEQLFEIRKDEEAYADGFAGRALYLMGYSINTMVAFLKKLQKKRNPKLPSLKYHNTATRIAILKASFEAQQRAFETAGKLSLHPKKIIGAG